MKIKSKLPSGDADGISAVEAVALKKKKPIVALVILEPDTVAKNLHSGEEELSVTIRRIEALLAEDVEAATRLLQRAFESRTGTATLPIELEEDVRDALKGVDTYVPETQTDDKPGESLVGPPEGKTYDEMLVKDLRDRLKRRGLDFSQGTKTELRNRLEAADAAAGDAPKSNVTSLFSDGGSYVHTDDDAPPAAEEADAEWDAAAPSAHPDPEDPEYDGPVDASDVEPDESA